MENLIGQGINAGDVKKLQDAGIHTCNDLMMHTKKSLPGITGLTKAKVGKIWEAAENIMALNEAPNEEAHEQAVNVEEAEHWQQLIAGDPLFEATENLVSHGQIERAQVANLLALGINTYKELKNQLRENHDGVHGLANVNIIVDEAEKIVALRRAESNLQKTINNIGKGAQRYNYNRKRKRYEVLTTSIKLNARTPTQIDHWRRERDACDRKLKNMRNNN
ncbi:uncharacterized protein LOC112088852 [Eutrema salsugineum]|uniref:uncharacterized protein LOC112088852 n=1 Tax=Eutrema salsugineum TaxID=72664 RepID=UPI000CECF867|nr:uncharacterized protein LOC112088852 [Eutrema salsugineum]